MNLHKPMFREILQPQSKNASAYSHKQVLDMIEKQSSGESGNEIPSPMKSLNNSSKIPIKAFESPKSFIKSSHTRSQRSFIDNKEDIDNLYYKDKERENLQKRFDEVDSGFKLKHNLSKDSTDSEAPLPFAPVPISPDSSDFKKFIKGEAKPIARTQRSNFIGSKGNNFTNSTPEKICSSSRTPTLVKETEESIDNFIQDKANNFYSTLDKDSKHRDDNDGMSGEVKFEINLNKDSKDLNDLLDLNKKVFTPERRKHAYKTHVNTPLGRSNYVRKFQINRSPDEAKSKFFKTEVKSDRKINETVGRKTPRNPTTEKSKPLRSEEDRPLKYQPMRSKFSGHPDTQYLKEERGNEHNIVETIKEKVAPIISAISNRIGLKRNDSDENKMREAHSLEPSSPTKDQFKIIHGRNASNCPASKFNLSKENPTFKPRESVSPEPENISEEDLKPSLPISLTNQKNQFLDQNNDMTYNDETISWNDSKPCPDQSEAHVMPHDYILSTPKRSKSEKKDVSDITSIESDLKSRNLSLEHQDSSYTSPLITKVDNFHNRSNTEMKNNNKLMEHSAEKEEIVRRKSIMPFKNVSLMKSKLPPSHLPNAKHEDGHKEEEFVDKLQAMHRGDSIDSQCKIEEVKVGPKFLTLDTSQESLEELARIDEELARANEDQTHSIESETIFKYEDIHVPPIGRGYEYTLVLDLDETLIHYNDEGYYLIRPGVMTFLDELSKYYEIILFTAALKDYADVIVDQIDLGKHIKHRLYRQH